MQPFLACICMHVSSSSHLDLTVAVKEGICLGRLKAQKVRIGLFWEIISLMELPTVQDGHLHVSG